MTPVGGDERKHNRASAGGPSSDAPTTMRQVTSGYRRMVATAITTPAMATATTVRCGYDIDYEGENGVDD